MSGITVKGGKATPQQVAMMRRALAYADKVGAPYKAKVALLEALTQESEFKNLSTPSADGYGSYGVLQGLERYHGKKNLMNPEYQFGVFLGRNKKWRKGFTGKGNAVDLARRGMKSGDIAQAVEGSAYPDRYQTSAKEVMRNIRLLRQSMGQPAQRGVEATGKTPAAPAAQQGFDAEGYDQARRRAIGMQLLAQKNPNSILVKTGVLDPTPPDPRDFQIAQKTTQTRAATHGTDAKPSRPAAGARASAKAQGLSPLLELFYDPQGGWDNPSHSREGVVSIGAIGGHSDHVHVAAGPKTLARLDQRAKKFGLVVSSADRPGAHTKSGNLSFHAVGKARDYAGTPEQMAAFTRYVRRLYNVK